MARYLAGFCAGTIIVFGLVLLLGILGAGRLNPHRQETGWVAWIRHEKLRLLQTPPGRIVVVAGSNATFGIEARRLEALTGLRTVNAASHVNVLYTLQETNPLPALQAGDILLLPLETQAYARTTEMNQMSAEVGHQEGLDYFLSLPWRLKLGYIRHLEPSFLWQQLVRIRDGDALPRQGYWRFGVDDHGDLDLSDARPAPATVQDSARTTSMGRTVSPPMRQLLCASIRSLAGRGVRVIGTPDNIYLMDQANIRNRQNLLKRARGLFTSCGGEWVDVPGGGLQPLERMYDTIFHPTAEGRRLRTDELARALCAGPIGCKPQPVRD